MEVETKQGPIVDESRGHVPHPCWRVQLVLRVLPFSFGFRDFIRFLPMAA